VNFANPLAAVFIAFGAGLIASISPCTVIAYPLIIGFVGGYAEGKIKKSLLYALCFSLGLAITFTCLGVLAALTGAMLGDVGWFWKYFLAIMAIVMGLQMMEVIRLPLPSSGQIRVKQKGWLGAFLLGLFFGLAISPCSTPTLAIVLSLVAAGQNIYYGVILLFAYSLGYIIPVFLVGFSAGVAEKLLSSEKIQKGTLIARRLFGLLFILGGIYILWAMH